MGYTSKDSWGSVKEVVAETVEQYKANEHLDILKVSTARKETWVLCRDKVNDIKFIMLLLIERQDGIFYLKEIEHSMGPNYHTCPLGFLNGVSENGYAKEWIQNVRDYHTREKEYKLFKSKLAEKVQIKSPASTFRLEYKRRNSWIATNLNNNKLYSLSPRFLKKCKIA